MIEPLALVCYARLLPGSQVVNRLQDLGYRVQTLTDALALPASADQEKPLLVVVELEAAGACDAINQLKRQASTCHVPILAFAGAKSAKLEAAARAAGATLVVSASGLLAQFKELLDQALEVR